MIKKTGSAVVLFACVCCMPMNSAYAAISQENEAEIERLEEGKRILQSRADFAGREADRIMFQDWLGYRTHLEAQERYENEAKILQEKIDQLKSGQ